MITLHHIANANLDRDPLLPHAQPVFTGSTAACNRYAADHGYTWTEARSVPHGGYFRNEAGDLLLPDHAPQPSEK